MQKSFLCCEKTWPAHTVSEEDFKFFAVRPQNERADRKARRYTELQIFIARACRPSGGKRFGDLQPRTRNPGDFAYSGKTPFIATLCVETSHGVRDSLQFAGQKHESGSYTASLSDSVSESC